MRYKIKSRSKPNEYHTVTDDGVNYTCDCIAFEMKNHCRHIETIKARQGLTYIPITGRCAFCGKREAVAEHHIWKRSLRPDMIHDPNNLLLLCHPCHLRTEQSHYFLEHLKQFYGAKNNRHLKVLGQDNGCTHAH